MVFTTGKIQPHYITLKKLHNIPLRVVHKVRYFVHVAKSDLNDDLNVVRCCEVWNNMLAGLYNKMKSSYQVNYKTECTTWPQYSKWSVVRATGLYGSSWLERKAAL